MESLFGFIVVVAIVILVLSWKSIKRGVKATMKGQVGEWRIHNELQQLPEGYEVLDNVTLRTVRGTTQIDHVVVSRYAIFAIETKNYRGQIYGSDYMNEWKQIIRTDVRYWHKRGGRSLPYTYITKNTFYNPVKQAYGHTIALERFLRDYPKSPIIPIVVFTGEADISTISTRGSVVYKEDLVEEIERYQKIWLTQEEVEDITEALSKGNISDKITKREHVSNVRHSIREKSRYTAVGRCPRCGGIMYKKFGTHGAFYACGNFPRCSYAENIKKEE